MELGPRVSGRFEVGVDTLRSTVMVYVIGLSRPFHTPSIF